ncbi:ABC transporter permease [Candidatus Woesearchaeota archaeon]|nr:ABC transporter permease [Candidatus Woesearchaeota archaeon]
MNWKILRALVAKNLRLLIRSKASSLVIVLGPLLLIFLAGIAFDNTSTYSLKLGVYAPRYTESVESIYDMLTEKFNVREFNSEQECSDAIKSNSIHACVLFSGNFTIGNAGENEITFVTDYSRVNIVGTIMSVVGEQVSEGIGDISEGLTKTLLDAIEFTNDRLAKQRATLVALTTENQIISESAQGLSADLSDIDLSFRASDFATSNITSSKKKIQHWVMNAFDIAETSLKKASGFISDADKAAGDSESIQNSLESSVGKIAALKENLATSKDLAATNFEQFDADLEALTQELSETKARFEDADESRELSVRVIDAVVALLDKSLINMLEVQHTLNEIDNKLNSIPVTEASAVVQPVVTNIRPVVAESSYLNYIFPSLIILVLMFTALILSPTLVLLERHSPAFFRSVMSPVNYAMFFVSTAVTSFIIIGIQLLIILAIASVVFSAQVLSGLLLALFVSIFICLMFVFLGMLLGYLFKSEETAMLAGISLGAILLFLSGLIVPLEGMPGFFQTVASFSPFVVSADLLRGIFVLGDFAWGSFLLLIFYTLLFGVVSFVAFAKSRQRLKRLVSDFSKARQKLFKRTK